MKSVASFLAGLGIGGLLICLLARYNVTPSPIPGTDHPTTVLVKYDRWTGRSWVAIIATDATASQAGWELLR
jgi:hypothetical protein